MNISFTDYSNKRFDAATKSLNSNNTQLKRTIKRSSVSFGLTNENGVIEVPKGKNLCINYTVLRFGSQPVRMESVTHEQVEGLNMMFMFPQIQKDIQEATIKFKENKTPVVIYNTDESFLNPKWL